MGESDIILCNGRLDPRKSKVTDNLSRVGLTRPEKHSHIYIHLTGRLSSHRRSDVLEVNEQPVVWKEPHIFVSSLTSLNRVKVDNFLQLDSRMARCG